MRALLLVLAVSVSGCSLVRLSPAAPAPVAPVAASTSPAAAARDILTAIDTLAPAVEAAATANTIPVDDAIRQVTALRRLAVELERLSVDLQLWSQETDPAARAARKEDLVNGLGRMGAILVARDAWRPLVDAYVRAVAAIGGAP